MWENSMTGTGGKDMVLQVTPQDRTKTYRKEGKYKFVLGFEELNYLTSFSVCFGKKDVGKGGGGYQAAVPTPKIKILKITHTLYEDQTL
jgi:hypothetical protein